MGDFSLAFKQINDKTDKQLNRIIKKTVFDLTSAIIQDTPVDTGRLRANWLLSFNTPIDTEITANDKSGNATIRKVSNKINNNKVPLIYWIQNNLPYAQVIEYGLYPNPVKFGTRYEIRDSDKFLVETGYVKLSSNGYSKKAPRGMVRINTLMFSHYLKGNFK